MRDIKFRIWDGVQMYIDYVLVGNTYTTLDENQKYLEKTYPSVFNGKEWVNCDRGIIMQYTGFKDNNGKEVYERDIVKDTYGRIMKVIFNNIQAKFQFKLLRVEGENLWANNFGLADLTDWFWEENSYVEVIGNIYENPELLEDK